MNSRGYIRIYVLLIFLVNSDKHVVLADFGVSRIFGKQMKKDVAPYKTMRIKRGGSTEMTVLGSDHYIAPEVLAGQEATPALCLLCG